MDPIMQTRQVIRELDEITKKVLMINTQDPEVLEYMQATTRSTAEATLHLISALELLVVDT